MLYYMPPSSNNLHVVSKQKSTPKTTTKKQENFYKRAKKQASKSDDERARAQNGRSTLIAAAAVIELRSASCEILARKTRRVRAIALCVCERAHSSGSAVFVGRRSTQCELSAQTRAHTSDDDARTRAKNLCSETKRAPICRSFEIACCCAFVFLFVYFRSNLQQIFSDTQYANGADRLKTKKQFVHFDRKSI